jgi:hypothetical protein
MLALFVAESKLTSNPAPLSRNCALSKAGVGGSDALLRILTLVTARPNSAALTPPALRDSVKSPLTLLLAATNTKLPARLLLLARKTTLAGSTAITAEDTWFLVPLILGVITTLTPGAAESAYVKT